jgi:hypothetical protein
MNCQPVYDTFMTRQLVYDTFFIGLAKWVDTPIRFTKSSCKGHEFDTLLGDGTSSLLPRLINQKVINKWVFKLKQKSNGIINRYKA